MKNIPSTCKTVSKNRIIKVHDQKSCACYFINDGKGEVVKILVDGCAITEGLRCDFLLISNNYGENFVELKGGDVPHALKQIQHSIYILSSNPNRLLKNSTNKLGKNALSCYNPARI